VLSSELDTWLQSRKLRWEDEEKDHGVETPAETERGDRVIQTWQLHRWLVLIGVAAFALIGLTYILTRSHTGSRRS
jgi:hypothetical protein